MPEAAVQPDLVLECSEAFFEPAITAPSPGRSPTAHTIKAHSALLILASPYFRRVLAGSTPEMPVSSVQVRRSNLLDPAASGCPWRWLSGGSFSPNFALPPSKPLFAALVVHLCRRPLPPW